MNRKKLLSLLLALVMVLSAFPISAFAAPASDIPDKMLDNPIVRALAYTGYNVQKQKDKTAFWLYPCIEYACASGMSFLSTDTKGDVMRNYGTVFYCSFFICKIDERREQDIAKRRNSPVDCFGVRVQDGRAVAIVIVLRKEK